MKPDCRIVLVGMMGSGKTTIGHELALVGQDADWLEERCA